MGQKVRKKRVGKRIRDKGTKKKLNLMRSVKKIGRMILKHLVENPEKERELTIAQLEREMTKKFKRLRGSKRGRR